MFSAIGRVIVVGFAMFAAAAAAIVIAFRLGLERATHALHSDDRALETVMDWIFQAFNLSFFATLLLAIAVIVTGEVARIRSALFYIAGGGLAVAAAPLLIEVQRNSGVANLPAFIWQVFATSGFVGGAVYWLLAGRRA